MLMHIFLLLLILINILSLVSLHTMPLCNKRWVIRLSAVEVRGLGTVYVHDSQANSSGAKLYRGVVWPSKFKDVSDFGRTAPSGNVIGGAVGISQCSVGGCKNIIFCFTDLSDMHADLCPLVKNYWNVISYFFCFTSFTFCVFSMVTLWGQGQRLYNT